MKNIIKKNYFVFLVTTLTLIAFSVTFANEPPKKYELKDAIHILQLLAGAIPEDKPDPEGVIGFDPNGKDWEWSVFENNDTPSFELVPNPDRSGENTTATVAKFIARDAGKDWAGVQTRNLVPFKLDSTNCTITIFVYKPRKSRVGIKLEQADGAGGFASTGEIFLTNTKINEWEKLTFDFKGKIGEPSSERICGLVIFPDFDPRDEDNVCYFDNISFSDDPIIEKVNTVLLEQAILRANALANEIGIGANHGQVSQTDAATFRQEIAKAQAVLDNSDATQQEVDDALGALETAIETFKNAIIGEVGDDDGDGRIYVYATDENIEIDLDFDEDYDSISDWGSGTTLNNNYVEDSTYQPVISLSVGTGWSCIAFSGFDQGFASTYQTIHLKLKGASSVKLKFPGSAIEEIEYFGTSASPLNDGWFEYTIDISGHGSLSATSEFAILNHGLTSPFYVTDIYFTAGN
jgi:hypothetical protein